MGWDTVFERLRFSNNSIPLKGTLVMRVDYTSTRGSWVWCRPKLPCCIASKRCYFYHLPLDGSFIVFWAFTCGSFREGTRARHSYRVLKMNRIMRQIDVYQMLSCLNYHFILYWTNKNIIILNFHFPRPFQLNYVESKSMIPGPTTTAAQKQAQFRYQRTLSSSSNFTTKSSTAAARNKSVSDRAAGYLVILEGCTD